MSRMTKEELEELDRLLDERKICFECGSTPPHPDSEPSCWCRRCAEKNGHANRFFTKIDHDKLRARIGPTLANEIIDKCALEYGS